MSHIAAPASGNAHLGEELVGLFKQNDLGLRVLAFGADCGENTCCTPSDNDVDILTVHEGQEYTKPWGKGKERERGRVNYLISN